MALVDLATAKAHLRVTHADEDAYIQTLIDDAEDHVSRLTGVSFAAVERTAVIPEWSANGHRLPYGPVTEITAVTYVTSAAPAVPLSPTAFRVDGGVISLLSAPGDRVGSFTVSYKTAADAPKALRRAVLLIIGQWFRNRMPVNVGNIVNELPNGVRALLAPFITGV